MSVVVAGVDGSERAADAVALATDLTPLFDAEVLAVHAAAGDPAAGSAAFARVGDVRSRTVCGPPVRALRAVAAREDAELIVLAATHRAVEGGVAAGSVAEGLLVDAHYALAVAPRGYAQRPRRLAVVGVAFVPGDDAVVAAAARLAARADATVRLLAVADPAVTVPDANAGRATAAELRAAQVEVVGSRVENARAGLGSATAAVLEGDPAGALTAGSEKLDLLVCGARDYGPVSGAGVDGVSKQLMRGARCPVLVIPAGAP